MNKREERAAFLENKLESQENDKRELEQKVAMLIEKLRQMQELVKSLESNREELIGELKKGHDSAHFSGSTVNNQLKEISCLKAKVHDIESELHDSREALRMINNERDEMQNLLDEKTEELVAVKTNHDNLYQSMAETRTRGV